MEHSFNSQIHKVFLRVYPKYTINQSFIIKKNKNMKKVIFRILPSVILLVAAIVVLGGCEKKNENNNENEKENKNPLKNTEWKLINFVDVANNTKKTPEPDSEKCYILKFLEKGDSLTAVSSTNNFIGTYTIDTQTHYILITNFCGTKIKELYDGILYVKSLITVNKYTIDKDILKLYYNDNKNYLEFKRK